MRRLLAIITSVIICVTLIPFSDTSAAVEEGVWQLVNVYYETTDPEPPSGQYYTEYFLESKYDEKQMIASNTRNQHLHNIDGDFYATFTGHCNVLTPTVKAGEEMKFYVESEVSADASYELISALNATITEKGFLLWFRDVEEYSHYYITSQIGSGYKQKDSAVVSREMSAGKSFEEKYVADLEFSGDASGGQVHFYFEYEWTKPVIVSTPAKATIKSVSLGTNKATVKWKKISKNCKGYEIEVASKKDFSDAKVYTINKNKTVKKAVSGLKEDVIYYIRVRAINSKDGQKSYGAYSKVKKIVL